MPNHCSKKQKFFLSLLWFAFSCNAFQVLHSLSYYLHSPKPSFGQLLCPSCSFVHCVLHFAHYTSFADIHFQHGTLSIITLAIAQVMHMPQANTRSPVSISLRYILHSLQPHSVHSLPIIVLVLHAMPAKASALSWF